MSSVDYLLPRPSESPDLRELRVNLDSRKRWLNDSLERAKLWYNNQRTTVDPDQVMNLLAGVSTDAQVESHSDLRSSDVDRNCTDLVSELANLRAEGQVKTDNKKLYDRSADLQKRYKAFFHMTRAKQSVRDAIAWAVSMGTGYITVDYDINGRGPGKGEHVWKGRGPHEVVFDGMPADNDIQKAYATHIIDEVSILTAKSMFPLLADQILPDRQTQSSWMKRIKEMKYLSPVLNLFGVRGDTPDESESGQFPTVDIITSYVADRSINMTGKTVVMGDPSTSWTYEVPSFNAEIPTGVNDKQGNPIMRRATEVDAMYYPRKRRVVWCQSCMISDGPNRFWHGKSPASRVKIKGWPWEANGTSVLKAMANVERAMTRIMRNVDDSNNVRLDPPIFYDENLVADNFEEKFDPKKPGTRIRVPGMQVSSDMVKLILPLEIYSVPDSVPAWIQYLEGKLKFYSYTQDVSAIAKARQIPSADSIEKMIEMAGPSIRDMLEKIEVAVSNAGEMTIWNFFQFDTLSRQLEVLGDDGVSPEMFDYDPGNLVPSHMPGEDVEKPSGYTLLQRGIARANEFSFYITPGSLHDLNRTTQRLVLIQAIKMAGLQVDPWTIANIFGLPYFGAEPENTHTIIERVIAWKRMQEEAAGRMAEQTNKGKEGGGQPGRPNTNEVPPHNETKDGGTRPIVSTSR